MNHSLFKSNIFILSLILFVNSAVFCQKIENDWKIVKPLRTDKATVDKLWGTVEIKNSTHHYETDAARISVLYSTEPCESDKYNRGEFNIAKDTVLLVIANVKKRIPLSEFGFDLESFTKEVAGVSDTGEVFMFSYSSRNDHNNISMLVGYSGGIEYVETIFINAVKQDEKTLKCSKIYKKS